MWFTWFICFIWMIYDSLVHLPHVLDQVLPSIRTWFIKFLLHTLKQISSTTQVFHCGSLKKKKTHTITSGRLRWNATWPQMSYDFHDKLLIAFILSNSCAHVSKALLALRVQTPSFRRCKLGWFWGVLDPFSGGTKGPLGLKKKNSCLSSNPFAWLQPRSLGPLRVEPGLRPVKKLYQPAAKCITVPALFCFLLVLVCLLF